MNKDEIQAILADTNDLFYDLKTETGTVFLSFSSDKEPDLLRCAKALKHVLNNDDNYLEINKTPGGIKYQCIIASPSKGTAITFEVPLLSHQYNELLLAKTHEDDITLGFYIPQKPVALTDEEISAIKNQPGYDSEAVITGEEVTYIDIKIPVEICRFKVRSDDQYQEDSSFVDLQPQIALALAAQLRESKKDDGDEHA